MFLSVCSLYLPANAQLTRTQPVKRVVGISFLEVPDVVTSGNEIGLICVLKNHLQIHIRNFVQKYKLLNKILNIFMQWGVGHGALRPFTWRFRILSHYSVMCLKFKAICAAQKWPPFVYWSNSCFLFWHNPLHIERLCEHKISLIE